jgi:hypothetical protein
MTSQQLYHPDLRTKIKAVITKYDSCQRQKLVGKGYSHMAPREAAAHP